MSWRPKYRCLPLLLVVVAMILLSPLSQSGIALRATIGIGWAIAFGYASYLVFPVRSWLRTYVALVGMIVAVNLLQSALDWPTWTGYAAPLLAFAVQSLAFYGVLRHALLADDPNELDHTFAAITGYFLLALIWTRIYQLIAFIDPRAFTEGGTVVPNAAEHTFVYFSLISITTVGYGDITPVNDYARLLGGLEGAVGTLYIAVVIASLVGRMMAGLKRA